MNPKLFCSSFCFAFFFNLFPFVQISWGFISMKTSYLIGNYVWTILFKLPPALWTCDLVLDCLPNKFSVFLSDNLQKRYLGDMHTNKKINNELKLLCKFLPKIIIITTTKSWVIYAGRNCWKKWRFFISCQLTVAQCYSPCNLFGKRCH